MKVYVSELPKKCEDCVFSETGFVWDSEVRFCKLKPKCMNWIALYDDKRDDCTLCSIADYTKQVRNDVVSELMNIINESQYMNRHNSIDKETLFKVLDQIQEDR